MFAKLTITGYTGSIPPRPIYGPPVITTRSSLRGVREQIGASIVEIKNLSQSDRALIGWFDLFEGETYDASTEKPGAPADAVSNGVVVRTYPNKEYRDIDSLKALRYKQIESLFEKITQSGIVFTPGNIPLPSDENMQSFVNTISVAVLHGEPFPANMKIRDLDGTLRPVTQAQFLSYQRQLGVHLFLARKKANDHLEAIEAMVDPATLVAYDITVGWPVTP